MSKGVRENLSNYTFYFLGGKRPGVICGIEGLFWERVKEALQGMETKVLGALA